MQDKLQSNPRLRWCCVPPFAGGLGNMFSFQPWISGGSLAVERGSKVVEHRWPREVEGAGWTEHE